MNATDITSGRNAHRSTLEALSDEELARRAASGDGAAWQTLDGRTRPHLEKLARTLGCTDADAPDRAQEALIRAWRWIDRYDPARPFSAWVRTILRRVVYSAKRTAVRRGNLQETLADESGSGLWRGPSPASPEEKVASEDLEQRCLAVIDEMGPRDRRALRAWAEGRSSVELAEEWDAPSATIRGWMLRARTRLRRAFEEAYVSPASPG